MTSNVLQNRAMEHLPAGLVFTGDAARQVRVSRQWLLEVRRDANIQCAMIGDYYLWTPAQIELAREIINKNGRKR